MRSSRNGDYGIYEETERPKKKHGGVVLLVILIIVGVAVAVIGVSKVGGFISDKIVTPVAAWLAPDEEADQTEEQPPLAAVSETVTESFALEENVLYALQVGVFSSKTNADVFAGELSARGGAGYVMEDTGNWRVLIAGYGDKADAESVQQRLKSEQGMESKLLEIRADEKGFTVTAGKESIEAIKVGVETANGLVARLCDMSIRVDKGELPAETAKEELSALTAELESAIGGLSSIDEEDGAAEIVAGYIAKTKDTVSNIDGGVTEISAGLKRAYIDASLARKDISETLTQK